jgi:hypothetical protein
VRPMVVVTRHHQRPGAAAPSHTGTAAATRPLRGRGPRVSRPPGEASLTDSTDSPEDARIAAARERLLADARRARRVGDQVAVRFDPRRGERDPTFDLDALGVQYTVTLLHDQQTGRAYLEARFALADVEWPL